MNRSALFVSSAFTERNGMVMNFLFYAQRFWRVALATGYRDLSYAIYTLLLSVLILCNIQNAFADNQHDLQDVEMLNGHIIKNVEVTRSDPVSITIRDSSSIKRIFFNELSASMRTKFGYCPVEAKRFIESERDRAEFEKRIMAQRKERREKEKKFNDWVNSIRPFNSLNIGNFGKLHDMTVLQVTSSDRFLAVLNIERNVTSREPVYTSIDIPDAHHPNSSFAYRVVSDIKNVSRKVIDRKTVIVRGYNTRGLRENEIISLQGAFKVTGTESYTTVAGKINTVSVIEPVGMQN